LLRRYIYGLNLDSVLLKLGRVQEVKRPQDELVVDDIEVEIWNSELRSFS
jgi:hypothetical protein